MSKRTSLAALALVVATLFLAVGLTKPVMGVAPAKSRFVDNGDGTVTDNQTRLMWEKKTDSNVNDTFTWSSTGTAPDGTLFTAFLATMTCVISADGTCGLAGHSDWRIPNIAELQTIIVNSTFNSCIDPIFGPAGGDVSSSTTDASNASNVWFLDLGCNISRNATKSLTLRARAVRGPF